jgi:HEAT repeat protein
MSSLLAFCGVVAGLLPSPAPPAHRSDDIQSLAIQAQTGSIFERMSATRVLGHSGDPAAFDPLVALLEAADREEIQVEAARALADLEDERAIPTLIDALAFSETRTDGTTSKGQAAAYALRSYGASAVLPLCEALSDPNPAIRERAAIVLGWLEDPRSVGPLIEAMADSSFHEYRYTYERFMRFGQPAMDALIKALDDDRPWLCIGAARSLAIAKHKEAADALSNLLTSPNARVRYEAALALAALDDSRGLEVLLTAFSDNAATMDYLQANRLAQALAKLGGRRAVDALIRGLADGNEYAKSHAAWALGEIGDTVAVIPLIEMIDQRRVHRNAVQALGKIGDPRAVEPLIESLENRGYLDSQAVVWALGEIGDPRAVDPLIASANSTRVRISDGGPDAAEALAKIGEPAVEPILAALKSDSLCAPELTIALERMLGIDAMETLLRTPGFFRPYGWLYIMGRDAVPRLIEGLDDPDAEYRERCLHALMDFKDPRSVEPICDLLADRDPAIRRGAAAMLGWIGDTRAVAPLIEALADRDDEVQLAAIDALRQLRGFAARPALRRLVADHDADVNVRWAAWRCNRFLRVTRVPYNRCTGWENPKPRAVRARWRAPTGEIYAVGDFGAAWVRRDSSYERMESGSTERLLCVWGTSAGDVFAVGEGGEVIHYDSGAWSKMTSGTRHDLYRVGGTAPDNVFAIGWAGTILHYDGSSWRSVESHTQLTLHDMWVFASDDIYVVGDGGTALHHDGHTWSKIDVPTSDDLQAIWGDSERNVYAGGHHGTLLHNWKRVEESPRRGVAQIWGLESGGTYLVADNQVYRLEDHEMVLMRGPRDGTAWVDSLKSRAASEMDRRSFTVYGSELPGGARPSRTDRFAWSGARAFWTPSPGHLFGVYDDWIRYTDGVEWYRVKLEAGGEISDIAGISPGSLYVLGEWNLEGMKDEVTHYCRSGIRDITPGTEEDLESLWAGSDQDVFAVGENGLILRYNGDRWERMKSPTEQRLLAVWGTSPDRVYAVGRRGTIVRYNGRKWVSENSNTRLDLNAIWGLDDNRIFAVGDGGEILRYDGRRWRSMDSGVASELTDVWGTARDHVFACGNDGVIVHFDGRRWTQMYTGTTDSFRAVGGVSDTQVFAATEKWLHRFYDHSLANERHANSDR